MFNISKLKKAALPVMLALVITVSGCAAAGETTTVTATKTITTTATSPEYVMTAVNFVDVIAKTRPSVVAISTEITGFSFFGAYTQQGAGSGWIISSDGLIVTNNHVVEGASTVNVTLDDGRTFEAENVYADAYSDLAIIKIDATDLPAASIGDSSGMRVGDWVVAIGNSLGMGISATKGIVSATGVTISLSEGDELYDLIQTDAAINPGNSGGPLLNLAGQVIGINSAKIQDVGVEGMGYAISIEEALPILQQLINQGKVSRPEIGVGLYTVDEYVAQRYNLPVSQGVLVTQVNRGSPADLAGIRQGDVIVALDDVEITTAQQLKTLLQSYQVGQTVQITYYHNQTKQTVSLVLAEAS
jgi:serine protease Do